MKLVTLATLALLALLAARSRADEVYDNGPVNGVFGAWGIVPGFSVSDSFTVSAPTALGSATVGLWADSGAPTTLDWSIGTTPFGSDISSGTATSLDNVLLTTGYWDIFETSFDISGDLGSAGTYYFTLSGASDGVSWDINNGPSMAYETPYFPSGTEGASEVGSNSDSFQLYSPSSVPDRLPTIWLALGSMLVLAAAAKPRRADC